MRQSPNTPEQATPRAKIAWRRAADELLIAAIFAESATNGDHYAVARGAVAPRTDKRVATPAVV